MQVVKLTTDQLKKIKGKTYDGEQFFNPIEDADGNFVISQIEADASDIDFSENELIGYNPKPVENMFK